MVTLVFERRWTWRGDSYGSGRIENPRIDVLSLGLVPLPLRGDEPPASSFTGLLMGVLPAAERIAGVDGE